MDRNDLMDVDLAVMHFMRDHPDAPMAKVIRAAVEAAEPLIRADERERTNTVGGHRQIRDEGRADMCADLRARVEALRWPDLTKAHVAWNEALDAVLTLIDGGSDD